MTTDPGITDLINRARSAAIAFFQDEPASPTILNRMAAHIRRSILFQVSAGQWQPYGVTEVEQMLPLEVSAVVSPLCNPPVRIAFNFSRTKLASLIVTSVSV